MAPTPDTERERRYGSGGRLTENYKIEKIWSEKSEKITVGVLERTDDESEMDFRKEHPLTQ